MTDSADIVCIDGRITTLDRSRPQAEALAVKNGTIVAVGSTAEILRHEGVGTRRIDLRGRRVIPGLNDSHTHLIRAGLNYNMELRWDGVPTLADAMAMLREQVLRTPAPQWVRVVGGFSEFQFAEKRLPTLAEINALAPDTPVFILHLYDRALLNGAALRAIGYTRDTPDPPGAEIQRDGEGRTHGTAHRQAERADPLHRLVQGTEAGPGRPGQFDPAVHARTEPPGHHLRHRRRRWLPGLPRRLRRRAPARRSRRTDGAHRLQPVHATTRAGKGGLPSVGQDDETGGRRR